MGRDSQWGWESIAAEGTGWGEVGMAGRARGKPGCPPTDLSVPGYCSGEGEVHCTDRVPWGERESALTSAPCKGLLHALPLCLCPKAANCSPTTRRINVDSCRTLAPATRGQGPGVSILPTPGLIASRGPGTQ